MSRPLKTVPIFSASLWCLYKSIQNLIFIRSRKNFIAYQEARCTYSNLSTKIQIFRKNHHMAVTVPQQRLYPRLIGEDRSSPSPRTHVYISPSLSSFSTLVDIVAQYYCYPPPLFGSTIIFHLVFSCHSNVYWNIHNSNCMSTTFIK